MNQNFNSSSTWSTNSSRVVTSYSTSSNAVPFHENSPYETSSYQFYSTANCDNNNDESE